MIASHAESLSDFKSERFLLRERLKYVPTNFTTGTFETRLDHNRPQNSATLQIVSFVNGFTAHSIYYLYLF